MVFNLTKNGIESDQIRTPVLNRFLKSFSKSLLLPEVPNGTVNSPFARKAVPQIQDTVSLAKVRVSVVLAEGSLTRDTPLSVQV
jgi:hypothetical protein